MREVTVKYKLYKFEELSTEAKEKVKQWYLEDEWMGQNFTDMIMEDLNNLFPNSKLEVQYDLGYCQGDGLNIYGSLNPLDVIEAIDSGRWGDKEVQEYKNCFTDKQKRTLKFYIEESGDFKLSQNHHYCYCIVNQDLSFFSETVQDELEYRGNKNINVPLLQKVQELLIKALVFYCSKWERIGYEYFYEIDEETLKELCESNDYEFTEDGRLWR